LRDVLDVEQDGNIVWVKTLHLGKIGIETTFEKDATIISVPLMPYLMKEWEVQQLVMIQSCAFS
jgi:hypothetical protein